MARYLAEHSLQMYEFVDVRPSQMAAASMYLALRMKKLGGWVRDGYHCYILYSLISLSLSLYRHPLYSIIQDTVYNHSFH